MLTQNQKNIILETLKPFEPVKIGIFGSLARNEEGSKSDIDILYTFQKKIGVFTLIGIKQELEEKLKKRVDLVSENHINPKIKPFIMNDLTLIYDAK
jgi:hypothetical protein